MATTSLNKHQDNKLRPIRAARLRSQLLTGHDIESPLALVQKMGALQAQHFDMAHWAIGMRLHSGGHIDGTGRTGSKHRGSLVQSDIHQAINTGAIVRTHVLRPTWHLIAGEDLLWLVALTGPAIKKVLFSRDKHLGIAEKEYVRSDKVIQRILEDLPFLSRQELIAEVEEAGLPMDEYRSNHYIMHAELNGIICSGPVKNGKHSYALSENVLGRNYEKAIQLKRKFEGAAGVYELARRYFSTRGPATLQDFGWWSGLSLTAIKKTISALGDTIEKWPNESGDYYQIPAEKGNLFPIFKNDSTSFQLLPAFDEILISYRDRTLFLEDQFRSQIITSNGLFRPAILEAGKVIGGWQVQKGKKGLRIQLKAFTGLKKGAEKKRVMAAEMAAAAYCGFRQLPLESIDFA